jgi:hypothetical protein
MEGLVSIPLTLVTRGTSQAFSCLGGHAARGGGILGFGLRHLLTIAHTNRRHQAARRVVGGVNAIMQGSPKLGLRALPRTGHRRQASALSAHQASTENKGRYAV